jgi:dolichyl-diphosphooligosaccharide--protein glycosyltransferase
MESNSGEHKEHTHHEHIAHTHTNHSQHSNHTDHIKHNFFNVKRENTELSLIETLLKSIWDNRAIIIFLIAIFLIAFGIRGHLLRYHYLFEFDAFYHARLVESLITTGSIPKIDPFNYYQVLGGVLHQPWSVYHTVAQCFYYLTNFGHPFSKDALLWAMQFNPVVFGSLICIILYFLAKEVTNSKKIGLLTALTAAITPAFAYRTMAGAQGDNAFGFFWMVLGFLFFVRAVKKNELNKETIINTIIAGIFFGLMSMTWRMYLLIPLIIIFYALFAIVLTASKQENHPKTLLENHSFIFAVKVFISLAIFHVMSYAYGEDWVADALSYVARPLHIDTGVLFIALIIVSIIAIAISALYISKASKETKQIFSILVILGLYAGFIAMIFFFLTVPDLSDRTSIGSMVGEESVGNNFFGTKYNSLIIFPWLALILLPISLWLFKYKEDSHTGILFFFWVIITLFMAWYTLKFTFVFGLAISPAVALVAYIFIEGLKRFNIPNGIESKVILVSIFLLILFGVGASARFFPDYVPYVDEHPEWRAAQDWITQNTPTDAKFFNWWDQGHILSFLTDRRYSTDNRNSSGPANQALAKFVVDTNAIRAYEIAAKNPVDSNYTTIGADYVILDSSMFNEGPTFEYYIADTINVMPGIIQKYYNGTTRVLNCSGIDTSSDTINCGGNNIPGAQWNTISTKWKAAPDDFQNGSQPIYYYRANDQIMILNQTMNNTNIAKAWLNSDETSKYYDIVYQKQGILILKIKK